MKRPVKLLFLITFIFLVVVLLSSKFIKTSGGVASPFPLKFSSASGLETAVEGITGDSGIKFGIYIKNLKSSKSYKLNESMNFDAASLYKLWVMSVIFDRISSGKLKEDDLIQADIKDLNEKFKIDEEEAELKEGNLQYTYKSAIEQMITISHNYAAFMLLGKASNSEVNLFLENLGLKKSEMSSPPQTTPEDIGIFYEKLYLGEIVSPLYSSQMLEVLKRQKINDRIPKYLPDGVQVAHKTGEFSNLRNDAGIVFSKGGDYIIVVLTEGKNVEELAEKIAQISRAVYDYFSNTP